MTCAYRHPAFDHVVGEPAASTSARMADADSLADRYATVSGDDLGDWPFYLGLAHFKLAVIAAGIQHRHDRGASGEDASGAGAAVPDLIAAGIAALRPTRHMARTSPAGQENP
ncbi:hypothetical protein [Aeromicrobium sp. UC242_57]|uniref:hypothetical protein n=1 Tax=Aeromicrobium sp. UC242_57 TaxID=3374624 RepID=UPI00379D3A86